jgi:pimeloyl-ACP methyl ester carboxylesterase
MSCLNNETLSLASARLIRLLSIPIVACFALSAVAATEPPPIKQLHANGIDLAYVEEGKGTTVVFVHGANGDWRSWELFRPAVAERYRYVSYSLRYHLPNPWPGDGSDYSYQLHAADLVAFIQGLNAGPVHLVGSSYGGFLVTLVALEHPELLRSAVVNDPGVTELIADMPDGKPLVAERAKSFGEIKEVALAGDNAKAAVLLYDWVEGEKGAFDKLSGARRERFLANASTMRPMMSQPAPPSISCATLGKVKVPMLVTRGEHDNPFYVLNTDTFASCLPRGNRAAIIPNAAHVMGGNTAFGEAVLTFLAEHAEH